MSAEYKGAVLDFDNTLVKTSHFILEHIKNTCEKLSDPEHIQCPTEEEISEVLRTNPPFEKIFDKLFGDRAEKVLAAYREDAMETAYEATDGGIDFVKDFNSNGFVVTIVSNRTRKMPERLAQAGYKNDWFAEELQADEPKPSENAYSTALKVFNERGVPEEQIIFIGDSPDDYLACPDKIRQNFFAVTTGRNDEDDFTSIGVNPSHIFASLAELRDSLNL